MSQATTTRLPNGNLGVHLPSGELADLAYVSAASLARMSEADYSAVMQWIAAERERRAERTAENESAAVERTEAQRQQMEQRHQGQAKWAQENRL
jgi:hypothetical protein